MTKLNDVVQVIQKFQMIAFFCTEILATSLEGRSDVIGW